MVRGFVRGFVGRSFRRSSGEHALETMELQVQAHAARVREIQDDATELYREIKTEILSRPPLASNLPAA